MYRFILRLGLMMIILGVVGCGQTAEPTPTPVPPTPTLTATATNTATPTATPTNTPTPTATPIPAENFLLEGDRLMFLSDWEGAEAEYVAGLALYPDHVTLAVHLAYLHHFLPGQEEEALAELQLVLEKEPTNVEGLAYQIDMLNGLGRLDEANNIGNQALALEEQNPLLLAVLSKTYLEMNRFEDALDFGEQAVALDKTIAISYQNLAEVYATMDREEDAIGASQQAYVMQAKFVPVLVQRAYFFMRDKEESDAQYLISNALRQDEDSILALVAQADIHFEKEEYEKGLTYCDEVVTLFTELADGYLCRGHAYLARDSWDSAIENFNLAIDRDVESVSAYAGLGRVYLQQDSCDDAREQFERIEFLRPYSAETKAYLGLTDLCTDDNGQAIERLQQAVEMNPYISFYYYGLGLAYLDEERNEDALVQFDQAIDLVDDNYIYLLYRGRALQNLERYDEAKAAYEAAIEIDDERIDGYELLGQHYLNRDQYWSAITEFNKAKDIDDQSITSLVGLGVSYAYLDECGTAMGYFNQAKDIDPDNFVANELYDQCLRVWRYDNPPGAQGDPLPESTALTVTKDGAFGRGGITGQAIVEAQALSSGSRVFIFAFISSYDPATNPTEFSNQINQALLGAIDGFVRSDSEPLYLSIEAYAFVGGQPVLLRGLSVHRTDAVDWWNDWLSDSTLIARANQYD